MPAGLELEVPISTNNHLCFKSIEQTKHALCKGIVFETGAKLNLNSLIKHHQQRLKALQPYYHTIISCNSIEEQVEEVSNPSGIIFHNQYTKHYFPGFPLTVGMAKLELSMKATRSAFTNILSTSGGICIGESFTPLEIRAETKTNTIELTRNPFNPEKTVGGSSGGAAASIAAGIGNVAIADDEAGSISIPAGFTGTIGIKPSSATCCVVLMGLQLYMLENHQGMKNYFQKSKIGFILKFPWTVHTVDPEIETAFKGLFDNVSTDLNCHMLDQPKDFPFDDPNEAAGVLWLQKIPSLLDKVSNVAWKAGQGRPFPDESKLTDFSFNFAHYFNIGDCPVITIPLGESSDVFPVPFGVQILGSYKNPNESLEELFKFAAAISNYSTYTPRFPQFPILKYCFTEDEWGFSEHDNY